MANFPNSQATYTLQNMLDKVLPLGDVRPVLSEIAGYQLEPFITICTDVYREIVGVPFPHKWNEIQCPQFYTNSLQQDYVLLNPDGTSFYNLEWLERGMAVEMTSNVLPKPWGYVECGRQLPAVTGTIEQFAGWENPTFVCNTFPNYMLYYGTWGANKASASQGNNPEPGRPIFNPLGASVLAATYTAGTIIFTLNYVPQGLIVGGNMTVGAAFPRTYNNTYVITAILGNNITVTSVINPGVYEAGGIISVLGNDNTPYLFSLSQLQNPICQIKDTNGNLQVVTQYGVCGLNQPAWPASNAAPGTQTNDGTVIWTVADPNGMGVRILPVPNQSGVVFQINLVGQMPAIQFTDLSDTIAPLPNKYESYFRQGVIAQCYRYSPDPKIRAKFDIEFKLWKLTLNDLRAAEDRELEENRFVPEQSIWSRGGSRGGTWRGAGYPFNYPGGTGY
jgi:hypothetical protein